MLREQRPQAARVIKILHQDTLPGGAHVREHRRFLRELVEALEAPA